MQPVPPPDPELSRLTRDQLTRLALITADLDQARAADLAALEASAHILMIERLRGSLDDAVRLIDELTT